MANKKITDLQLRSNVTADLNFPSDDSIQSYRVTAQQVKDYVLPSGAIDNTKLNKTALTAQTADTSPSLLDQILSYDASADALKKVSLSDLMRLIRPKNLVDNAEFRFWQRQIPATLTTLAENNYGPDRWLLLSEGAQMQSARVNEQVPGSPTIWAGQFRQANGAASRFGVCQIVECEQMIALRGKTVTFGAYARTDGTEVPTLRAAIVEWTGNGDVPTRDLVATWGATPTLVANAVYANTPADIPITNSWAQISVTATLSNNCSNLYLFVWTPNQEANQDDFYLTQVQLVDAPAAVPYQLVRLSPNEDLARCQRFYEKSYNLDVAPGSITTEGAHFLTAGSGGQVNTTVYFKVTKRVSPSFIQYLNPAAGGASMNSNGNPIGYTSQGSQNGLLTSTNGAAGTATVSFHWHVSSDF